MSARASLRKGWCPGALRPMPAGDGLLVRVRLATRRLEPGAVAALAVCAARFGNGVVEISSRANLQLRGVSEAALPVLQRRLAALGLIDADPAAEGVRNIVASPLSDSDPDAILDVAPLVADLESWLRDDPALRRLPPKFGFLIDGGGALPLGDVEADVRFEAFRGAEGPRLAVTLAGAGGVAAACSADEAGATAAALARAFLREAGAGDDAPRRMRGLVARDGAGAILAAAGLGPAAPPAVARRGAAPADYLGVHACGARFRVGAAPPLGRLTAAHLRILAAEARRRSAADIRLTPWRALLITGLDGAGAEGLAAALARQDFILDPGDRRLAVAACAGAPACANAARPTLADALELAAFAPSGRGVALHVSGCAKGCAHGRAAPFTLIARESGYDLVRDGRASDAPTRLALSSRTIAELLTHAGRTPI